MTVVLFCGGLGLRLRAEGPHLPKPMVDIGGEPILRHLMGYYAAYGHRRFVLCLGYRGEGILRYFVDSPERVGAEPAPDRSVRVRLRTPHLGDWRVDLVPTGDEASIGERLWAVRRHVDAEVFLANYADGLSDLDLPRFLARFALSGTTAGLISVPTPSTFHLLRLSGAGLVQDVRPAAASGLRVNGGFFAFRRRVFDVLRPGEDLLDGLFPRLVAAGQLFGYRHDGFWACMDTAKDRHALEAMHARGDTPWQVWRRDASAPEAAGPHAGEQPTGGVLEVGHEARELR